MSVSLCERDKMAASEGLEAPASPDRPGSKGTDFVCDALPGKKTRLEIRDGKRGGFRILRRELEWLGSDDLQQMIGHAVAGNSLPHDLSTALQHRSRR